MNAPASETGACKGADATTAATEPVRRSGSPSEDRSVWVVETRIRELGWRPFDCRRDRASAWALAREDRKRWPKEKFRVVRYTP